MALISAGGSGLGAAAAKRLATDGFKVAILSSSGKGEALANELGGIGVTGSNQSNDDLQRLVDAVMRQWGRIDVLVNSGGHGPRGPVLEITDEQWHLGLDIYLMNVIRPVRIVAPIMQAQKSGSIINFSSVAAFEPVAGFPTSAVFRAGLAAYAKVFADTYAADNVRMNNIQCGWIDSLPTVIERCDGVPMKRYGSTAEIAATVAFLASEGGVTSPDRTCGSMAAWDAPYSVEPEGLCGAQPSGRKSVDAESRDVLLRVTADRQVGSDLADDAGELEAMPRARRDDHDAIVLR